tara:strand:- start:9150 stop:9326 length:177 start_codon:yes stop_codon:yes gene_type:complete
MANKKITDLTEITIEDVANDDLLIIVDVNDRSGSSAGTTKKIQKSKFLVNSGFIKNKD